MKAADDNELGEQASAADSTRGEQANHVTANTPGEQATDLTSNTSGEQANDVTANPPGGWVTTRLAACGLLAVAAAVLAFLATRVSGDLTRQRQATCDGLLPMPASAYVLGWSGVGLAVVAAIVLLAKRSGGGWRVALLVLSLLALAFAGFVTYTVYADAPTTRFMCSG
ncbi:hypothetical protein GCM10029964_024760 [Kibdelosporangium lantanae]